MKIFSKTMATVASAATALSLGFTLLGPTQPANAAGIWRIQSATTGKCVQWNGIDKNITLAKCAKTYKQYWGFAGVQLVSAANDFGAWCLDAPKKSERAPIGRGCVDATTIFANDKRVGHTTYMSAPGKYLKTVNGKLIAGDRTANKKKMQWKLIA